MILGGAMIIGFSAFKGAEAYAGKAQSPVTLYFTGNTTNATEVADETRWKEMASHPGCDEGEIAACSIIADPSDVTGAAGSRSLNPSRIQLDANSTGTHYTPSKNTLTSAPASNPISVINKS